MKTINFHIAGSAFDLFPTESHFGLFSLEDGSMAEVPQQYPFSGPWGELVVENVSIREQLPLPVAFEMAYLSVVEEKFYYLSIPINSSVLKNIFVDFLRKDSKTPYNIIVGMTPYGGVSLWLGNTQKQMLLGWLKGSEIDVPMQEFLPQRPELPLHEYCMDYINNDFLVKENLEKNGLPPRHLFDKYMQQFTYRYLQLFEHWNDEEWLKYEKEETSPELDYIEEALFDGTHDKLHDGGLMNYHEAGKPKTLSVQWHIKKSEYTAYFWFEDEEIRTVFDRFYGAHPETKTDFMIRIDSEKKKFELALYRYGLKEPQVINESAYQLIVFKNKFEYYRSENYDQPRGAWIW